MQTYSLGPVCQAPFDLGVGTHAEQTDDAGGFDVGGNIPGVSVLVRHTQVLTTQGAGNMPVRDPCIETLQVPTVATCGFDHVAVTPMTTRT